MKELIATYLVLFASSVAKANMLMVSNTSTYVAQYSTITDAVAVAASGDTIYIFPTGISNPYNETVNIDKKLVLIGGGPYANRVTKLGSWVKTIRLISANAEGAVVRGLGFSSDGIYIGQGPNSTVNNVIISDCYLWTLNARGNNLLFENNIFANNEVIIEPAGALNIVFRNNIFNTTLVFNSGASGIVENNLFAHDNTTYNAFRGSLSNTNWGSGVTIRNSIFYKLNPGVNAVSNAPFINNLYFLTNNPPPANALSSGNLNADPKFVGFPPLGALFSITHDYHLQISSPGINYGTDGTDAGVWGGSNPINAYFEPPIPRVIQLSLSNSTLPPGGQVQINFKATKAL